MLYADTGVLVSLHVHDSGTASAVAWLEGVPSTAVLASDWGRVEFASALGILARRQDIPVGLHRAALARFREFAATRLTMEVMDAADYQRAAGLLERHELGLRAGDSLHLAVCTRRGATMCTRDMTLAGAAEALAVPVQLIR